MKTRVIFTISLFVPFLYCLVEFFAMNDQFSIKARDFKKFFNEKSLVVKKVKSMAYAYYSQVTPYKISSICPGIDKFIFYCPITDGNPLRDLFYDTKFQTREAPRDFLLEEFRFHKNFFYLDIPSKFRIYSDKWPLSKGIIPQYVLPDIAQKLYSRELGDRYYSVRRVEDILRNSREEYLYYYRDTHWTLIGASKIIEVMGLPFFEKTNFEVSGVHGGDLVGMSNTLAGAEVEIIDKAVSIKNSTVIVTTEDSGRKRKFTNSNQNGPKVLVVGDSFRESFSPVLAESASVVDEFHLSIYKDQKINPADYDFVFVLRTERYIPNGLF